MQTKTRRALIAGFVLHGLAVMWIWIRWDPGLRGTWLVWVDLPWSLLWVQLTGWKLIASSLLLGGCWWAALTAALTLAVGRLTAGAKGPRG